MHVDESAASSSGTSAIATGAFLAIGVCLIAFEVMIAMLSNRFQFDIDFASAPITTFVTMLLTAGFLWLALSWLVPQLSKSRLILVLMLLTGLVLRIVLFGSHPILEVDFYRYLWDGAVLANGYNPYALAPVEVPSSDLVILAKQAGTVFDRINYRDLSTIYPPIAQALFALSYWLDPWQLFGFRLLLLIADLATLGLILIILRRLRCSPYWASLYWWNPLLITLTYNGAHMDMLLLPFLMAAVCLLIRHKSVPACGFLTLAAGIKLWPLLLIPFALRNLIDKPRQLLSAIVVILCVGCISLLPMLILWPQDHSGLVAFSQQWERNSAFFPQLVNFVSLFSSSPALFARLLIAAILTLLVLYLVRKPITDPIQIVRAITVTIATLFLLSPIQLPWYCFWFLPLLCIYPHPAYLILISLMPIYFLRFHFDFRDQSEIFDQWIVWCQYLPPLLLLYQGPTAKFCTGSVPKNV